MANPNQSADGTADEAPGNSQLQRRHADFAARLNQCADLHPDVPELGGGRLTFVQNKLASHGVLVSLEAVRRWFSGQAVPRRHYAGLLAEMLRVDTYWLLDGGEGAPQDRLTGRTAAARGAVNLVASLIQLDGGAVSFPDSMDGYADLRAKFGGFYYTIRVLVAEETQDGEVVFMVRNSPVKFVHIGVVRKPGLRHEVYVISDAAIDAGKRVDGASKVSLGDKGVRRITSFEKALES